MKKFNIIICCLALSVFSISCQKEAFVDELPFETPQSQTRIDINLTYTVDGHSHNASINSTSELNDFVIAMSYLVKQYHIVTIQNHNEPMQSLPADRLHIETQSVEEFNEWQYEMILEGYDVNIVYDRDKNLYIGDAVVSQS